MTHVSPLPSATTKDSKKVISISDENGPVNIASELANETTTPKPSMSPFSIKNILNAGMPVYRSTNSTEVSSPLVDDLKIDTSVAKAARSTKSPLSPKPPLTPEHSPTATKHDKAARLLGLLAPYGGDNGESYGYGCRTI